MSQSTAVLAYETNSDELAPYEERLAQLNEELGTDYQLYPSEGWSDNEMIEYFSNMTIDEFESYIVSAYQAEQECNTESGISIQSTINESADINAAYSTQRYYYDANGNSLYLKAYITVIDDTTYYTGEVYATGSTIQSYPAYKSNSCYVSFSNNNTTAACTWTCVKYVSANVISATSYHISCTFTSEGGSIYPSV